MKQLLKPVTVALRIWGITILVFCIGWTAWMVTGLTPFGFGYGFIALPIAIIGSLPVLVVLTITIAWLERMAARREIKIRNLVLVCFLCTFMYGLAGGWISILTFGNNQWLANFVTGLVLVTALLFTCSGIALYLLQPTLRRYFTSSSKINQSIQSFTMDTANYPDAIPENNHASENSNKTMIKGIITGVLILVMMIPTVFISNLVQEREGRQREVAAEVSSKWASSQTLSGPYLYLPYKKYYKDKDGKIQEIIDHFWILPDQLEVSGRVNHEIRPRSIYKVLLYRADLKDSGHFVMQVPKDVDVKAIQWNEVKMCYGLSDFKGIEEKLAIRFKEQEYEFSPGLPGNDISVTGLSVPVTVTEQDMGQKLFFDMKLRLKGSEQLHFVPLGGNSNFSLRSAWPSPSFDGNNLPSAREVTPAGFTAQWAFNKANLSFGTVLKDFKFDLNTIAFGVTMLQPADQYAKTSRSVKYAILFIGLTFALFFIVELTQKRPVHPVQYVLIGLALVIFYTLLLSVSEFILFDYAYLTASLATIVLITLYAWGHFRNWKPAGIFFGILSTLYGFIFVLIRLEDTALLVGSIGLFVVLALVMYASRKINWYGRPVPASKP